MQTKIRTALKQTLFANAEIIPFSVIEAEKDISNECVIFIIL